jgi:hypothetical protein
MDQKCKGEIKTMKPAEDTVRRNFCKDKLAKVLSYDTKT